MGRQPRRTSRASFALLVGLGATVIIAACHLLGLDHRAELMALDFRFRRFPSAPANDGIVVVAIDDHSLQKLGQWPWPREILAGIAEVLQACGARAVALDIIMPEPQKTRFEAAEADVYDPDTARLIGTPSPRAVFDDALFEGALRKGLVLLPMHIDFARQDLSRDADLNARVGDLLRADPQASFASVLKQVFPNLPPGTRTPQIERAAQAYWRNQALRHLRRFAIGPGRIADYPARSGVIYPPLVRFAAACDGSGFVTFQPEIDSVMRRIPLLARSGDEVYPQFAFAVAARHLAGGGRAEARADRSQVSLAAAGHAARSVPVDRQGNLLINWRAAEPAFREIPAASVAFVWQLRKGIEKNKRYSRLISLALAQRLGQSDLLELFARVDGLYQERIAREIARQRAALYDPNHVPPPATEVLAAEEEAERKIEQLTAELLKDLDVLVSGVPADDPSRLAVEALAARHAELAGQNEQRLGELDAEMAQVRREVGGRICLVGSTATGAADFVPTPVEARMPGVKVHANIFNTIVSGAFVTEAPRSANVAAILLAGAMVTLLAARLPLLQAGPAALLLAAGYGAVNFLALFGALNLWLVLAAPLAAMLAAFLGVTAYRQVTEERAKRHIRGLFAHALSPALVDRLIEDPSLARLGGERRVLSCFFSDLTHFTPLAERLGEQGTVALLNRYFDRMTDVIQNRCGGYLNKFLGDGIVGFFGAPVVQEDHARRALAAAVACQEEVARLNESLVVDFGDWVKLSCRIGIATGPVMVGNCGSSERMDYTAIGDCVNVASRLESANKQFGTWILTDERAWAQGRDDTLLARPLGRVLVVGKVEPVGVWNVIGPIERASPEQRTCAADFATAVELFAERRFDQAAALFEAILRRLPGDRAGELYLSLCRQHLAAPPAEDWDGAVQLTEK